VSSHLELPPVLTYAAANLWNFSSSGTGFSNVHDLSTLLTFTGTESESWFLLVSVAMEATAGTIIPKMMRALAAVKVRDYQTITRALVDLEPWIHHLGHLLETMYERCDPMTFYHLIRPFLAGSKNMEHAGLPNGIFYDEGDGKGEWRQYRGGSNGQSSLIQFLDVVLGVEHATHGSAGQKSYHHEVREYMPGPHRRFLVHVARAGSIRELALACGGGVGPCQIPNEDGDADADALRLREAYVAATEALAQLRNKHIQIVARYIILPSKQPWDEGPSIIRKRQNLASSSSTSSSSGPVGGREGGEKKEEEEEKKELTGTGGTALVSFLKQSRDETVDAGNLTRLRT
jgi:indoleamine 2,3-dioxygenase